MYNKTDGLIEQHIHGAFGVDFTNCSPDDLLYAANELAKCGIMQVSITGGEPLIRSDFLQLLDAFKSKNIIYFRTSS